MAAKTGIQWTDATWNPTTGCTRVSEGCRNCYAFQLHDKRHAAFKAGTPMPAQYAKPFKELQMFEDRLMTPLSWRKPKRIFVDSMSDLFHKDVPDRFIEDVFHTMARCPQHTFQVLTKRPERMPAWFKTLDAVGLGYDGKARERGKIMMGGVEYDWPLPNVWLGTSVENQAAADERIPHLLRTPSAVRFLSCEPLLGPVDLTKWLEPLSCDMCGDEFTPEEVEFRLTDSKGESKTEVQVFCSECRHADPEMGSTVTSGESGIDWVIVGGESGRFDDSRPFNLSWARSLLQQCRDSRTAFFMKQVGTCPILGPEPTGQLDPASAQILDGYSHHGSDQSQWPDDLRVREFPITFHEG